MVYSAFLRRQYPRRNQARQRAVAEGVTLASNILPAAHRSPPYLGVFRYSTSDEIRVPEALGRPRGRPFICSVNIVGAQKRAVTFEAKIVYACRYFRAIA